MQTETIVFTAPRTVQLLPDETKLLGADSVAVKMEYTVVSGGTERANLLAMPNVGKTFPKYPGYCGVGYVVQTGANLAAWLYPCI